jgi:PBSX family phage terminase large subunit
MKATIVFQKNWEAINEPCPTCDGSGLVNEISCSWCGDGETKFKNGNGKKYKYIVNRGSSRSSKTYSLIQLYDLYARSQSNKRCTIWRDTKTDCKKTVLNDMLKYLKSQGLYKLGQDFNKTESIFTYSTDSTVEIHGTDDEETVHGLTQDMAWLNEPYKISPATFNQIDQRTSDFVFIDYNPKKGHWVENIILYKNCKLIDSTFKDNPFCPIQQKLKILSYQPISFSDVVLKELINVNDVRSYDFELNPLCFTPKQIREIKRCVVNEDNNSASEFDWQVYGLGTKAEKPNRIFKWKQIPLQEYQEITAKIYYGVDWGNVDPFAIVEAKYFDGNLYLRELNYSSESKLREKLTSTEAQQIDDNNEGIVTWLFNKLGISKKYDVICDTNRPLKIRALREHGYQAQIANKVKGSILDGIDILENLNVYYTSDSVNIHFEQENYSRKTDRYGVILEEPEDLDNHTIDAIRYIALHLKRIGVIKVL